VKLPWKQRQHRQGTGLLTVLTASSLLMMLAFTVAGTSFHHLNVSNRIGHAQRARNLAEAALAQAVAELLKDPTVAEPLIAWRPAPYIPDGAQALFTFVPGNLPTLNGQLKRPVLQVCLNNLTGTVAKTDPLSGRSVPAESAYLRAVGIDHGVEKTFECMIYVPRFPWAVAAAGPVYADGETTIAGVEDPADVGDPTKHRAGHITTNANVGDDSVKFVGDQVTVTGDVQSASGANLGNSLVKGEKRLYAPPVPIPRITLSDYDTAGKPGLTAFNGSVTSVSGYSRGTGNIVGGDLHLNGGVVYVDGDVQLNKVTGEGAIITTGKLEVAGGDLSAGNKMALLAGGELKVGNPSDRTKLSGVIYSEKKLTADKVDLFGNAVSTERNPGDSELILHDSKVMTSSSSGLFEMTVGGSGTPLGTIPKGYYSSNPAATSSDPFPVLVPAQPPATGNEVLNFTFDLSTQFTGNPDDFILNGDYVMATNYPGAFDVSGNPLGPGTYVVKPGYTGPLVGTTYHFEPAPPGARLVQPSDLTVWLGSTPVAGNSASLQDDIKTFLINSINSDLAAAGRPPLDSVGLSMVDSYANIWGSPANFMNTAGWPGTIGAALAFEAATPGGGTGEKLTIDLFNQYTTTGERYSLADKIRVLFWREVQQP